MSKTYKLKGQWKGKSAGGCQNHPTWRYNPQLFLSVPEETTVRITLAQDASSSSSSQGGANHIGFYVARADNPDRRQLIIGRQNLVAKAKFEGKEEVSADAVLPAGPTYVVIPCTFNPGCEGGFTISFTAEVSLNLAPLPPSKEWKYISCLGSWESRSAGGCRNHPSCIRNPQFLLRVRRSGDFTILLSQTKEKFDAVGFYVVATKDPEFMLTEINSSDIVAKADFARPSEAIVTASLDKKVQYVIVPCTFDPGFESEFKLEIFGDSDIRLKALKSRKEVELQGEWLGATAGGCINHPTWRNNPQYFLFMRQTATVTITLVQDGGDDHSVGFYVVKTTGNRVIILLRVRRSGDFTILLSQEKEKFDAVGFYVVATKEPELLPEIHSSDIVAKADFARSSEAIVTASLDKKTQYVIVPCTFDPGYESTFKLEIFGDTDIRLKPLKSKKEVELQGEWFGATAGGCVNYPTWRNNPQYFLFMRQSATVTISLVQEGGDEHSIGFYVVKTTGNRVIILSLVQEGGDEHSIGFYVVKTTGNRVIILASTDILGKGAFDRKIGVSCELTLEAAQHPYCIIPCTFAPNLNKKFQIFVNVQGNQSSSEVLRLSEVLPCNYVWSKKAIRHEWLDGKSGGCRNSPETW
eukprot:CAMPEP_0201501750 /NCGR_PEP_ID=MMETSP0151_2-20130828/83753_1 /ASSEMBLY_ACC=CAM_ASM_000257 /TAXON_ID=200890 /ORGANISM="Paramoeba atlantica, Strain 621/1 / CCAP 1560/9" /LENGTH=637 /DNA_ID=CAMNT_0047895279 /DNA_START=1709 /DNA_END=3619 /DNA_ORIENTATION=+